MSRTTFFKVYSKKDLSLLPIHEKLSKLKLVSLVKDFLEVFRIPTGQYCLAGDASSVLMGKTKYITKVEIQVTPVVFNDFDFKSVTRDGFETKQIHPNIMLKRDPEVSLRDTTISTFKEVRYTNV